MQCSLLLLFKCPSQTHMVLIINIFYKYECVYVPNDHCNDSNHARLIKQGCLVAFSIKQLYTWPNVMELCFYHWRCIQANSELAHGQRYPKSSIYMSKYDPQTFQFLKDHIWIQLNLGHTTKQIYDKHTTIWWECMNPKKTMMRDEFIQQQNITYSDQ